MTTHIYKKKIQPSRASDTNEGHSKDGLLTTQRSRYLAKTQVRVLSPHHDKTERGLTTGTTGTRRIPEGSGMSIKREGRGVSVSGIPRTSAGNPPLEAGDSRQKQKD